jgi:uncharacterized membrane protein
MLRIRTIVDRLFGIFLLRGLANTWKKVREVNAKFKTPRVKMTRMVAISLFLLRFYLFFLVAILLYKFWTLL